MCTREEVLSVARDLNFYPTEEEIKEVVERYDEEAESDPSGNCELWIENLLYNMEVRQVVPPKYSTSNPKLRPDSCEIKRKKEILEISIDNIWYEVHVDSTEQRVVGDIFPEYGEVTPEILKKIEVMVAKMDN